MIFPNFETKNSQLTCEKKETNNIEISFIRVFTGNQGQAIQFRQTALSAPYYVHIWYHLLGVASGLNQHPLLSSKMDKFLAFLYSFGIASFQRRLFL